LIRQLVLTNSAEADLRGIWIYSAQVWGEHQANRYLDTLRAALISCGEAPERGRSRDEVRPGTRSIQTGRHVIYYRFDDQQVVVQRVLHGAMDPSLHPLG